MHLEAMVSDIRLECVDPAGVETDPAPWERISGASLLASSWDGSCALSNDAALRCRAAVGWDGGTPALRVVPGLGHVVQIAGHDSVCGRTDDGRVACLNRRDLTQPRTWTSTWIQELPEVIPVAGLAAHACAVARDGAVYCWGQDINGQLGNGVEDGRGAERAPARVLGLTGAVEVEVSMVHSCARLGDGSVWCWGNNRYGQCGDGSLGGIRATPVQVILVR